MLPTRNGIIHVERPYNATLDNYIFHPHLNHTLYMYVWIHAIKLHITRRHWTYCILANTYLPRYSADCLSGYLGICECTFLWCFFRKGRGAPLSACLHSVHLGHILPYGTRIAHICPYLMPMEMPIGSHSDNTRPRPKSSKSGWYNCSHVLTRSKLKALLANVNYWGTSITHFTKCLLVLRGRG